MQIQKVQYNSSLVPSFAAKLDVKQLNHCRWNSIAKKFEQITKEYPNDTLTIQIPEGGYNSWHNGLFNGELIVSLSINNNGKNFVNDGCLSKIGTRILTGLQDNEIVDKFVKLHKTFRTASDMHIEGKKFLEYFKEKFKDSNVGLLRSKLYDAILEARKTSISSVLSEDSVWSRWSQI